MKIQKATAKDIEECIALSKSEGDDYWAKSDFNRCVIGKDVVFLVAREADSLAGYAIGYISPTRRSEALIHETRVAQRYRGKNIGTLLVRELSDAFFKRKVKVIYAMIEPKLEPFYIKACGYRKTGTWVEASMRKR